MAKKVDPLKAKQKKQKIIAGVLGVLFLGLLAFQVPRVMKQLHPAAPPPSSSSTTPAQSGTPSLAAPTLQGASQGPATTPTPGSSSLASGTTTVQDGQLASFSRFASKDPFSPQLSDHNNGGSSPSSGSSSPDGIPAIPGNAPAPGSAVISINGTLYDVVVGADFPEATNDPSIVPLFHLVSATAHTVKVSIVGGSYANGAAAVTLKENKPVTLMNTADGTRYKLVLKPQGTSPDGSDPTTTTPTVTLPPATP